MSIAGTEQKSQEILLFQCIYSLGEAEESNISEQKSQEILLSSASPNE